jgi:hypothetical protein
MKSDDKTNWMCNECINILPFNHLSENDEFMNTLTKNDSKPYLNCQNLLFNPFELLPDNDKAYPCSSYDADQHYFNQSHEINNLCNSNYYNIDEFNNANSSQHKEKQCSMYHCNIRSVTKNGNNLSCHLNAIEQEFDVIALSETWLNDNNHQIIGFPNYNHVYKYRPTKIGGGVSILLKSGIHYHELTEFTFSNDVIECLFIEIEMSGKNLIIGCIYRPPNSNLPMFSKEIYNILHKLSDLKKHI